MTPCDVIWNKAYRYILANQNGGHHTEINERIFLTERDLYGIAKEYNYLVNPLNTQVLQ